MISTTVVIAFKAELDALVNKYITRGVSPDMLRIALGAEIAYDLESRVEKLSGVVPVLRSPVPAGGVATAPESPDRSGSDARESNPEAAGDIAGIVQGPRLADK